MHRCDACEQDNKTCPEQAICFTGKWDLLIRPTWHICVNCEAAMSAGLVRRLTNDWYEAAYAIYDTLDYLIRDNLLSYDEAKYAAQQLSDMKNRELKQQLPSSLTYWSTNEFHG
jgi:hypothetical protein